MHAKSASLSFLKHFPGAVLAVLLCFSARAQYKDAGLWASASLEKKLDRRLSVTLAPQIRLNENITELYKYFADAGISYKLKDLRFSFNYRFLNQRRLDDSYSRRHRFFFDLAYKLKLERLSITYRLRYQNQFNDIGVSEDWQVPSKYVRNKLAIKYLTDGKFQPFVSGDLWYHLQPSGSEFNNFRFSLGTSYELNKFSSIDLAYIINKEFNSNNPVTSYIISLGYNYSF
ncbi:MAG: DUF2490 domain-containing protein [Bacteroidia bacterium]